VSSGRCRLTAFVVHEPAEEHQKGVVELDGILPVVFEHERQVQGVAFVHKFRVLRPPQSHVLITP